MYVGVRKKERCVDRRCGCYLIAVLLSEHKHVVNVVQFITAEVNDAYDTLNACTERKDFEYNFPVENETYLLLLLL